MSKIYVVGIGPGAYDQMTGRAIRALNESDVIIGYTVYVDLVKEYFAGKEFMTMERLEALEGFIRAGEARNISEAVTVFKSRNRQGTPQ